MAPDKTVMYLNFDLQIRTYHRLVVFWRLSIRLVISLIFILWGKILDAHHWKQVISKQCPQNKSIRNAPPVMLFFLFLSLILSPLGAWLGQIHSMDTDLIFKFEKVANQWKYFLVCCHPHFVKMGSMNNQVSHFLSFKHFKE